MHRLVLALTSASMTSPTYIPIPRHSRLPTCDHCVHEARIIGNTKTMKNDLNEMKKDKGRGLFRTEDG